MKKVTGYVKIAMYLIISFLLVMSSYLIILNIKHYNNITVTVSVSEADSDYSKYKENVNLIEKMVNNYSNKDSKIYLSLSKALNIMKTDGVYRLIPKTKINNKNIYELNEYFIEALINAGWISNIKGLNTDTNNQIIMDLLINDSKYLNTILINSSQKLSNSNINKIEDNYHFILRNYMMYSEVILSICNGGINE